MTDSVVVTLVAVAGVGIVVGSVWAARRRGARILSGETGFLCDRCKYNDARYCSRPARPNATDCDEFKAR